MRNAYNYGSYIQDKIENIFCHDINQHRPSDPVKPSDSTKHPTKTDTKILEIKPNDFLKKQIEYVGNNKNIYYVIWGQCSEYTQDNIKALNNTKINWIMMLSNFCRL